MLVIIYYVPYTIGDHEVHKLVFFIHITIDILPNKSFTQLPYLGQTSTTMLYLNLSVLALAAVTAAQLYPNRVTPCSDNKACGQVCYGGTLTVQLNDGEVSFVCAADNAENTAKFYIAKYARVATGKFQGSCMIEKGKSCLNATGCLVYAGDLDSLNSSWRTSCEVDGGTPSEITGLTVGYDEGMKPRARRYQGSRDHILPYSIFNHQNPPSANHMSSSTSSVSQTPSIPSANPAAIPHHKLPRDPSQHLIILAPAYMSTPPHRPATASRYLLEIPQAQSVLNPHHPNNSHIRP